MNRELHEYKNKNKNILFAKKLCKFVNTTAQYFKRPLIRNFRLKAHLPTRGGVHMHDEHAGIDFIGTFDFVYFE